MTAPVLEAREGRPPTTVDGLSRALSRTRSRNVDLAVELHCERAEGLAFATLAIGIAAALYGATKVGNWFTVQENAGRLDAAARRYQRQRGAK